MCEETILLQEDCQALNEINYDLNVLFVPSKPASSELGDGRPIGGLAIFYRKSLSLRNVMNHENFHVVKLEHGVDEIIIVNVYMPCDTRGKDSLISYQFVLRELQNLLDDIPANRLLLMGNFNAGPTLHPNLLT